MKEAVSLPNVFSIKRLLCRARFPNAPYFNGAVGDRALHIDTVIIISLCCQLLLPSTLFAEQVELRSGKIIPGQIVERTPEYVKIKNDSGLIKIRFGMMTDDSAARLKPADTYETKPEATVSRFVSSAANEDVGQKADSPSEVMQPAAVEGQ